MKILITTDWYKPVINGVVTSVVNLERELKRKGHDVKILTLSGNHHSKREDNIYYMKSINFSRIYPDARASLFMNREYIDEIVKWKPDVIHSQCEFTTFIFAKKISSKLNIPIVHTYHTIYEDYTHYFSPVKTIGKKAVAAFSKNLLNHVDAVVAPTDKVNKLLIDYGIETEIYTVPTGIDIEKFDIRYTHMWKNDMKKLLKIPLDNTVLITVGRLAKEKNIEQLIDYMNRLSNKKTSLLIVGDGPYRQKLEQDVQRLGLNDKIIFTGMISPEKIPSYYQIGDIFVSASSSETQGLTYIEALASGLPAICRKDQCLSDVIYDGYNGYQYDSYDSFKNAIESILNNHEEYQIFSKNAKNIANGYSTGNFADKVETLYRKVI